MVDEEVDVLFNFIKIAIIVMVGYILIKVVLSLF